MKILHLAPIKDGFIVGDCEYQTVVAVMEDGGEEFAAVLDHNNRSCHIVRIINKNSNWKFYSYNMDRIGSDEQWDACSKFLYDNGLGVIVDGLRLKETGTLKH